MNILSLFDGMSCGQIALNRIGIKPSKYYAAEIDKYAIKVTQANYPNTIQLGSVTDWREWQINWSSIDLVSGGFPCQAWSMAGKQLGDKDERGMLFWVMLDIMKHAKNHNPKIKFLIENVKMKKEFEEYITHHTEQALGEVNKVLINSALVSAQNRQRYYWCNWHVEHPEDKSIILADIIEGVFDKKYSLSNKLIDGFYNKKGGFSRKFKPMDVELKQKSYCLTARYFKCGVTDPYIITSETSDNLYKVSARKLTPQECERLQTVPDNYTNHVSNTQRYKMLGNGWTVDVIAHIFKFMIIDGWFEKCQ